MAISGIIGSIRVALGLDTAQFQNGAKDMQGQLGGISKQLKSFAAGLGAALSFGAIVKVMQSAINKADELGKTAQKIGLPVEALSKLEYAARLADVELSQLSVGVGKLSQALANAAGGNSNDATKALEAIGVAAVDSQGKIRPTEDVIYDVAEAFSLMEDGAGKTALAMAIFGRSGKDLIPLLNSGAAGLRESADEAARFGLVIDTKTAKAAEKFNDNLTRLKGAMEGLTNKAMVALIDKFVEFTDWMVKLSKSEATTIFFDDLSAYIQGTVDEFNKLVYIVKAVGIAFDVMTDSAIPGFEKIEEINKRIAGQLDAINVNSKENIALLNSLDIGKPQIKSQPLKAAPIIQKEDTDAIKAADKAAKDLKRTVDSIFEDTRTPIEQYQIKIRELNELLAAGEISHETYSRAVKLAQDAFAETEEVVDELGASIKETFQNQLSGVFDDLIAGSFNLKDSLMDVLSQVTKLATNNALQALFNPSVNPSQAGGGFGGFFKNLLGFAKGGTIFPGGSGGQDSQLVAFRKSPNERVDITKPGQSLHSGSMEIKSVVNNYTSAQVEQHQDGNGNLITEVRSILGGMIGSGEFDKPLNTRYGQKPIRNERT